MLVPGPPQAVYQPQTSFRAKPLPSTLYHLTLATNWLSIEQYGLLSTRALLDLAGMNGVDRERIEHQHRAERVVLPNGMIISDQKPMPPTALKRCLHNTAPEQWYALLNRRNFCIFSALIPFM